MPPTDRSGRKRILPGPDTPMTPETRRRAITIVLVVFVLGLLFIPSVFHGKTVKTLTYSALLHDATTHQVASAAINNGSGVITGKLSNGTLYSVERPGPRPHRRGQRPAHRRGQGHLRQPVQPAGPDPALPDLDPAHRRLLLLHQPPGPEPDDRHDVGGTLAGQAVRPGPTHDDLRRRRRLPRRQAGDQRGRGVPQEPRSIPRHRRDDPQGDPARGATGHGQDHARARGGRRGRRALLLGLGLGLHGDVRRRGRQPRARPVHHGAQAGAGDRLRRRDRLHRPQARRRPRRRPRRARADPQPDAQRDGRLRGHRGRGRHGRDQPARRAGPGAAATGPLRPPDRRSPARPGRAPPDPPGPLQGQAARLERGPEAGRARHPGHERRRPGEPGQRVGAARRAAQLTRRSRWRTSSPRATGSSWARSATRWS